MLTKVTKRIIGIFLVAIFTFNIALPAYANVETCNYTNDDYEFNEKTGHLTVGKDIENKKVTDIVSVYRNKIRTVTIKDGVEIIGENAFLECNYLISITIPNSVKHIKKNAFFGCTSLKEVQIPNNVESIGEGAFQ